MNKTFISLFLVLSSSRWSVSLNGEKNDTQEYPSPKYEEDQNQNNAVCTSIFQPVGNYCLFVDETIYGTWQTIRDVCQDLGGDLPNLSDANFLADIKDYLIVNNMDHVNYWVGSNDIWNEGVWQWVNDFSQVKLGTPLWGDLDWGYQEPTGGASENCGIINHADYYFMHDSSCTNQSSLMCQQFKTSTIPKDDGSMVDIPRSTNLNLIDQEFYNQTHHNYIGMCIFDPIESGDCPYPYQKIYNRCLFINTLSKNSWEEHKFSCETLGGHMIKLDDANVLGGLFNHLTQEGIQEVFWIGATDEHQEGYWHWYDGSEMRTGTPFWGDDGFGQQYPRGGVTQNCAVIYGYDHYYFHDQDCQQINNVICEYDVLNKI